MKSVLRHTTGRHNYWLMFHSLVYQTEKNTIEIHVVLYMVAQKSKLSYFVHIFAKYWPIFTFFQSNVSSSVQLY